MTIRVVHTPAARAKRVLALLVLVIAAVVVGPQALAQDSGRPDAGETQVADTYTVMEGETLWSIATLVTAPNRDVRDTIDTIQHLNGMTSSDLRAGQQILIPALS